MRRRRGLCFSLLFAFGLALLTSTAAVQAFGPYQTFYKGRLNVGADTNYEFTYQHVNEITHHAFTFAAHQGEILTLSAHWTSEAPPMGTGGTWQPDLIMTPGEPPVGPGEIFEWDLEAAIRDGLILPKDMNNRGDTLEDWVVPQTGIYTLYIAFYPYAESSGGTYSVSITPVGSVQPDPAPAPDTGEGVTGEFPQLENGDRYITGTLGGNRPWTVHSFPVDPGDMLSIMAWAELNDSADPLTPKLVLCEGGCDPANPAALASDRGDLGIAVVNYQVPPDVSPGTLYTALVDGGATSGAYNLWMRQWRAADLLDQVTGGWMGEFTRVEGGGLRMDGVLTTSDTFKVHSFYADPGDSVRVTVTAKRDTPADELIPVILLVPGGYEPGEQWLAMDAAEDDTAAIPALTIPAIMPPQTLYTVVVADTSNTGQLLFGEPPWTEYGGGYVVTVDVSGTG